MGRRPDPAVILDALAWSFAPIGILFVCTLIVLLDEHVHRP